MISIWQLYSPRFPLAMQSDCAARFQLAVLKIQYIALYGINDCYMYACCKKLCIYHCLKMHEEYIVHVLG